MMQRLCASVLLIVAIAGVFAPAALGLSLSSQHACCVRKTLHCHEGAVQAQSALSSGGCAQHSCCRSLAVRQWAQAALPVIAAGEAPQLNFQRFKANLSFHSAVSPAHAGRAPPEFPSA